MKLPDKFQMRLDDEPGFTHIVTKKGEGAYTVKWARGWEKDHHIEWYDCTEDEVQKFLGEGWLIVDQAAKKTDEEVSTKHLPDEFWFCTSSGTDYKATKRDGFYQVTWTGEDEGTTYSLTMALGYVRDGIWKLCKASLTPEQQRAIKEFKEQLTQLDSSIRIAEQTIEHHNRMIGNYQERQEVLRKKIAEMEGL